MSAKILEPVCLCDECFKKLYDSVFDEVFEAAHDKWWKQKFDLFFDKAWERSDSIVAKSKKDFDKQFEVLLDEEREAEMDRSFGPYLDEALDARIGLEIMKRGRHGD